jgi:hypothetical protein
MDPGSHGVKMTINKDELQKLKPAERIKKLKELEEQSKKEIEEAEDLIKKTEAEIERDSIAESVKVPEAKPVDISKLFEKPEGLEAQVQQAPITQEEGENKLYQLAQAYEEAKGMLYSEEPITEKQKIFLDQLGERLEKVKYSSQADQAADLVVATRSIMYKIRRYHLQ